MMMAPTTSIHIYTYASCTNTVCMRREACTRSASWRRDPRQVNTICTKGHHLAEAQPSVVVRIVRLTRRSEGVLDCIALGEVAQGLIRTLDDMSIQSSYIVQSTDSYSVFCCALSRVHCTSEGSVKDTTTLHCPIVYPLWGYSSVTVSTDEGELV